MTSPLDEPRPLTSLGIEIDDMVVSRLLTKRAAERPGHPFVVYGDETWTFGEVEHAASALAASFQRIGVSRGTRVALLLPNGHEFVNAYFALSKLGAICIPLNTAYRGYILEYVLNDTAATALIAHTKYLEHIRPSLPALESMETLIMVDAEDSVDLPAGLTCLQFEDFEQDDGEYTAADVAFNDVNCVIYTSGTTGPSKGVLIENSLSVMKALEFVRAAQITADDRIYAPLPLFHSFGLLRGVMSAVVSGCTCVLRERFSASSYWDDVRKARATVAFIVFSMQPILAKAPPSDRDRDHPVRCMISAHYDPEFEERFGVKLLECYGLTEAGLAIYARPGEEMRVGSCGRVSEDWEVKLVDERDLEVPAGEVGEIVLRPVYPGLITSGYLNKPEATAAAFRNLWFHTGDLATRDDDGYFYFRDRKKDAIRRRGENISSWELEKVLCEHPDVLEAAAVPYPSPLGEDDVRVILVRRADDAVDANAILAFCTTRLPDFMVPRYIEFRSELPRTPNGKLEKQRLRDEGLANDVYDRGDPREAQRLGSVADA